MEKKTKNILLISGIILAGISYLAYRKYKSKEKKSNLVDEMLENFGKPIAQFTITNVSSIPQNVTLFDAYNNINYKYSTTNDGTSNIIINPSLSFFNQTLLSEPKKLNKIKVMVNSGAFAQAQATQYMTKTCKDASGNMASENYLPMVSTKQYQGNMTEVEFKNFILDGECVLNYQVQANTTVTFILDYKTDRKWKRKGMFENA